MLLASNNLRIRSKCRIFSHLYYALCMYMYACMYVWTITLSRNRSLLYTVLCGAAEYYVNQLIFFVIVHLRKYSYGRKHSFPKPILHIAALPKRQCHLGHAVSSRMQVRLYLLQSSYERSECLRRMYHFAKAASRVYSDGESRHMRQVAARGKGNEKERERNQGR